MLEWTSVSGQVEVTAGARETASGPSAAALFCAGVLLGCYGHRGGAPQSGRVVRRARQVPGPCRSKLAFLPPCRRAVRPCRPAPAVRIWGISRVLGLGTFSSSGHAAGSAPPAKVGRANVLSGRCARSPRRLSILDGFHASTLPRRGVAVSHIIYTCRWPGRHRHGKGGPPCCALVG